jgi:hypothetical protein
MVKLRRHHNNTGLRQIKRGKTESQLRRIVQRLKMKYKRKESDTNERITNSDR